MKNLIVALVAFSMLYGGATHAYRCTPNAGSFANQLLESAKKEASSPGDVKSFLDKSVDIEHMSKSSLGPNWKTLTSKQKSKFMKMLKQLMFTSYFKSNHKAGTVNILSHELVPEPNKTARLSGVVVTKNMESEVSFVLGKHKLDCWMIQDVIIDEVSMIDNYREQFTLIIKKSGVEGLLNKMQKKIDHQSKSKVTQ